MNEPMFTLGPGARSAARRLFVEPPLPPPIEARLPGNQKGEKAKPLIRALPAG